ncbi:MAG: ABC-type branched-chain amino acid transport system, ATPase component [Actinomycetia bacterium]|nr:ABC-type branched-chain amino acid transport system, ATPase component [Actinomycetes bacterium]
MSALLEVRGLSVRYGGVKAVDEFDIDVRPASITGLIGPNGAGKTSLMDGITGFTKATGSIVFDGRDIAERPAHDRARAGMARTWQSLELFDDLTVGENLAVAMRPAGRTWGRAARRPEVDVEELLSMLGLDGTTQRVPAELSQGQRKVLGLARAMAGGPTLLLADEPAAGLDSSESEILGARLRTIAESGVGVLLIDHDMGLVLNVCDHVYVMEFGRALADGTPAEIRANRDVIDAYLGGHATAGAASEAEEVLQ